ncbi:LPXTG cell wall anchor domain-containing protein [Cellulosimicrobium sp. PMB13]|uniref:LPXTG cell wall anchor domain-containing protein n=1 Tax=Cellulosimicrobium sp. PMB13 TaxID=3120158 RepID=UPI003F4B179C
MRLAPATLVTTALTTATATALVLAGPAATAVAGGSDAPTPYTVTAAGVTLPAGTVFRESNHVNYRVTALDGTGETGLGLHFDPNVGHPGRVYIGSSTFDFYQAAQAFPEGYCVTWVQVDGFDEHYGEGGQAPLCTTTPLTPGVPETPETPVSPETPAEPETPTEPGTDEPTVPVPPVEVPENGTPSTPEGGETPVDVPAQELPEGTTPVGTDDAEGAPAPSGTGAPGSATLVGNVVASADQGSPATEDELATTGGSVVALLAVGVALALGGAGLLVARRRRLV